jgi:hypothetical protein
MAKMDKGLLIFLVIIFLLILFLMVPGKKEPRIVIQPKLQESYCGGYY